MVHKLLIEEHVKKHQIRKANLGCGLAKKIGFLNVDREPSYKPDFLLDFDDPWPLPNNWFERIDCEHCLEHVKDVPRFMNLCHEILKPEGVLNLTIPYWSGRWSTGDPTHIHHFNEDSFNGWTVWFSQYRHLNQGHQFIEVRRELFKEPADVDRAALTLKGFGEILGMFFVFKKPHS